MQAEFLDARQLEAFKAVVDAGNITKAAQAIGKSQSSVTRLIQDLESDVGYALLNRSGPRIALTQSGLKLYDQADHYLRALASISHEGHFLAREMPVELTIASISALVTSIVPEAIASVPAAASSRNITISATTSEMVTKAVLNQQSKIGLIGFAPEVNGINFHFFGEIPFVALVHSESDLANRAQIELDDFNGRTVIAGSSRYRLRLMFERALGAASFKSKMELVTNTSYACMALARMKNAVAIVQSSALSGLPMRDLKAIPLGFYLPFHFGLITPAGAPLSDVEIDLIAAMEKSAAKLPGYRKCTTFPSFGQPL